MTPEDLNEHAARAAVAVRHASALCESVRKGLVPEAITKDDRSPVTIADFGAQAVVSLLLSAAFPDIPLVGEEDADALRGDAGQAVREPVLRYVRKELDGIMGAPSLSEDSVLNAIDAGNDPGGAEGLRWVLDPIDGTKGFLRGDQYAIALALLEDGRPVLGVLGCPFLPVPKNAVKDRDAEPQRGCMFVAKRSQGAAQIDLATLERSEIRTLQGADPARASFCESVEAAHSAHDVHARIGQHLGVTAAPVRMDSQCKYGAVARGQAAIYLRLPRSSSYQEKIWDHAAGAIVVEEAGGRVTDMNGNPLDFSRGRTLSENQGIVATNGAFHDAVLEAIEICTQ